MGSESWFALAPFGDDAEEVLAKLQASVFANVCALTLPDEPQPRSIAEYRRQAGEEGTRSVLDVVGIAESPRVGYAGPLPREVLATALGTVRPTRRLFLERKSAVFDALGRGEAGYVVCWSGGRPSEVVFFGWSFD